MTKQIEDYPELDYDLDELRADHLSGDGLAPIEIDYLFQQIDSLTEQNKELKSLQEKYVWITREEMKGYSDIEQELSGKSLAQHDKEVAIKAIESLSLSPKSKAGCIGEFKVDYQDVCPTCWNDGHNPVCDICRGESDEDGYIDTSKGIPWDTQKEIFKRMLSNAKEYAIKQLQEQE